MDVKEILKHVDHTLLLQPSTWEEIKQICDDAMEYKTASVCIPPSYVKQAAEYVDGKMAICTVIGKNLRQKMPLKMVLPKLIWLSISDG